jgi:uncharacterized protein with PIN domain
MEWLWYSVVLLYVLGMVMWFALSVRTPRCHDCRVPAVGLAHQIGETSPPIFQMVYRCPRCHAIIWKRFVNAVYD